MTFKPHFGELSTLYNDIPGASISSNSITRESSSSLTLPSGSVTYKHIFLEKATLVQSDYTIHKDIIIRNKLEVPCLEIDFSFSDTIHADEDPSKKRRMLHQTNYELLHLRSCKGFATLEENIDYSTFEVHFSTEYLHQWYGSHQILDQLITKTRVGPSPLYRGPLPITIPTQTVMNDIHQCPFIGTTRKMYLEAKVQELFALQLDLCECMQHIGQKASSLSAYDIERIREAKEYIRDHINTPCSIIELAHKVGINDFKLKQGFKELFGTTVFGYLQEIRMKQARQHLQACSTSISEIAERLGYQNQSAFTSAFKKYFGYPPSTLRK